MALKAFGAAGLLALVGSASAVSVQFVNNYCNADVYLTLSINGTQTSIPTSLLPSGQAYENDILGKGNTAIVSKNPDIYTPNTSLLVLGTSTDKGILYWSVYNQSGDAFAGQVWNVTSSGSVPDACGHATDYNAGVHGCADQDVTLSLDLCA